MKNPLKNEVVATITEKVDIDKYSLENCNPEKDVSVFCGMEDKVGWCKVPYNGSATYCAGKTLKELIRESTYSLWLPYIKACIKGAFKKGWTEEEIMNGRFSRTVLTVIYESLNKVISDYHGEIGIFVKK